MVIDDLRTVMQLGIDPNSIVLFDGYGTFTMKADFLMEDPL